MTNYEMIKDVTPHELARLLCDMAQAGDGACEECPARYWCHQGHNGMIDWLHSQIKQTEAK